MGAAVRHAVSIHGDEDSQPIVFSHGFGCDQSMWEAVASQFTDYRTVLFDLVGFGNSTLDAYVPARYSRLNAHADDVVEMLRELQLSNVVFVGHSVSSMIGVLAANQAPELFDRLVLVGPSPRYIGDVDYTGGFSADDIEEMLESVDADFAAWSAAMAPVIAGNAEQPEFGRRLTQSFCRSNPEAARQFARVTFLGDNRADLPEVRVPTLVLQCTDDLIAPTVVGRYVADNIPGARFQQLLARGHCPNLTAPEETARAIRSFLE